MKAGLIVPSFGNETDVVMPAVHSLVAGLDDRVDLHVFPLLYPARRARYGYQRATVHAVGGSGLRVRWRVARALETIRREHCRAGFDMFHAIWLFEPGLIGVIAGKLLGVPCVVSIGGVELVTMPDVPAGGMLTRRSRLINRQVLARSSLVTGGSRQVLDLAHRVQPHRPADRLRFAPLPVDTAVFSRGTGCRTYDLEHPHLFHAAALIPVKDQDLLLRAVARASESIPGITLDIAGEDPLHRRPHLEQLAADLGISGRVRFLGRLDQATLAAHYRTADLFLLTSRVESQGMVVLEAAACGVPTVGTDVGVVRDLAPDAARAVRSRDPDELAAEIVGVLQSPAALRELGDRAYARARAEYSVRPATARFLDLYREVSGMDSP